VTEMIAYLVTPRDLLSEILVLIPILTSILIALGAAVIAARHVIAVARRPLGPEDLRPPCQDLPLMQGHESSEGDENHGGK